MPAFATGDGEILARLFSEFSESLQRYALRLTHDEDDASDLVQETFTRALSHLNLLGSLNYYQRRGWLYQVLKNRFLDQLRAQKRAHSALQQITLQIEVDRAAVLSLPYDRLVNDLPESYREVITRHYYLGMTSEEISRQMGIPAATVRSRLRLALKWIRGHQTDFE